MCFFVWLLSRRNEPCFYDSVCFAWLSSTLCGCVREILHYTLAKNNNNTTGVLYIYRFLPPTNYYYCYYHEHLIIITCVFKIGSSSVRLYITSPNESGVLNLAKMT